ncbi:GumC family protein [Runella slithyformis]|uniref:Lipopolysaccharide biosynthesis protein n=1 Tax=Runella slithyformis (strain ATCC 29530 / DSM 19594 / LMG 11500 / NCIMB 11436 / LSU 4) TaxID=761193 RepID=A0A7U3ZM89_RUNSL|nr:lipopolysaccharide biosynthesis protein [Runella slithyformis]AEI49772.1 lipopolysaccharide biosynthesis protein [Runella slithyformis DSM 19594]
MTFNHFIRLLKENIPWIILFPLVTAGAVYLFTRNEQKEYTSKATVYTGLASGYSIQSVNKTGTTDYATISNAFDNLLITLNSTETKRQIGLRLLEQHIMLQRPDSLILSEAGFNRLQEMIPSTFRQKLLADLDSTGLFPKLKALAVAETANPIKTLVSNPYSYYSAEGIDKKLKANRKNSSDMIDLEYESDDRGVTRQMLVFAIQVLNERYISLKSVDANPVIDYYKGRSQEARNKLEEIESKLREFNVKHQLVNFAEESKNTAFSRDGFAKEYTTELMRNRALKAGMDALQKRMGQQGNLLVINDDLLQKQTELLFAETEVVSAQSSGQSNGQVSTLQAKADIIKEEMKEISRRYYAAGNSPESIPQDKLVDDWLAKVIDYEESNARLDVYKKRLSEFQSKISEFSPLGTDLHQLQRELDVAEKEYLALTSSLNQAQIYRKDVVDEDLLKIVDSPNYPMMPKPSKRLLLVVVGFAVGFFIALLMTVVRFLLDSRLDSPENAEVKIGKPVTLAFPVVKKLTINSKESRAAMSTFEQLTNAINIEVLQSKSHIPNPLIAVLSMRSKQGKTWVANGLARVYAETGQNVAYFYPQSTQKEEAFEENGVYFFPYSVRADFMNVSDLTGLLENGTSFATSPYHKIILELPPLVSSPLPLYLFNKCHVSLLIVDSNSIWGRKEKQLMEQYNKISLGASLIILNRVEKEYIDAPTVKEAEQISTKPELLLKPQRTSPSPFNA